MEIFGKPLKTRVTRNRVTRIRVTRGLAVHFPGMPCILFITKKGLDQTEN